MIDILSSFHIDWKVLIAQLVNFTIVVFVLWFFALKPLAKKMAERSDKIEKSLADAKVIEEKLEHVSAEEKRQMIEAKKEAEKILAGAQQLVDKQKQETVDKAKAEVAKIVEASKKQIAQQKQEMVADVKKEVSELVILAAQKIIAEKLTDAKDQKIIEDVIKNV